MVRRRPTHASLDRDASSMISVAINWEGVLAHLICSIGNGDLAIAFRITSLFETCGFLVALIVSPFGAAIRGERCGASFAMAWWAGRAAANGGGQEAAVVADLLACNVGLETDDID